MDRLQLKLAITYSVPGDLIWRVILVHIASSPRSEINGLVDCRTRREVALFCFGADLIWNELPSGELIIKADDQTKYSKNMNNIAIRIPARKATDST